jgi:hypothetical protein
MCAIGNWTSVASGWYRHVGSDSDWVLARDCRSRPHVSAHSWLSSVHTVGDWECKAMWMHVTFLFAVISAAFALPPEI